MAQETLRNRGASQNLEPSQYGSRRQSWPSAYSPFGMMRRFADDMDRVFEGFGLPGLHRLSPWGSGQQEFSPELDVLERDGKLVIRADLPGLNKDNVTVDVSEHSVTIEGERKCEHEQNEQGVYTCERSYGHFRREVPLPEGVKADSAKANFKDGILEITFDAPQSSKNRRRIQIGGESGSSGSKRSESAA